MKTSQITKWAVEQGVQCFVLPVTRQASCQVWQPVTDGLDPEILLRYRSRERDHGGAEVVRFCRRTLGLARTCEAPCLWSAVDQAREPEAEGVSAEWVITTVHRLPRVVRDAAMSFLRRSRELFDSSRLALLVR